MNLKKIGLTALAGSLIATSAMAGGLSVSGGAKMSYTTHGGNDTASTDVASGFAMDQEMAASGSGELDNGMVVTVTHQLSSSGSTSDSSYLTLDMGDMGTLSYSDDDQHGGLASLDDVMPKAYEEADDGFSTTTSKNFAEMPSGQGFGYTNTVNGLNISLGYSDGIGAETARTDGGQDTTTASTNSSSSIALTYTMEDLGLTVFGGMGNEGQADGKELDHSTVGAKYAYGPVTVGYQTNSEEDSDSTASNTDLDTTIYSVAFNVNENFSLSYGEHNTEKEGSTKDQEIESVQASYSMGGMTINIKDSEATHGGNVANKNTETTEVLVTFAF
jgi:outer membrane protein OmpU